MHQFALVLGCFLCASQCFGKRVLDSQDASEAEVPSTSGVLARLVLALKPAEAAFNPSPFGMFTRDLGVLPRRTHPIRLADDDEEDTKEARAKRRKEALRGIFQDVKNADSDAIKFKNMRVEKRIERIETEKENKIFKQKQSRMYDKESKVAKEREVQVASEEMEAEFKQLIKGTEIRAEEKWRKEFGYEEAEKLPERFKKKTKRNLNTMMEELISDPIERAAVPHNGTIVVAGAGTTLGKMVVTALAGVEKNWTVTALVPTGFNADLGEDVEVVPFKSEILPAALEDASAVVVITEAVGGEGGITEETMATLLKSVQTKVRRMVMTSIHGVDRIDSDFGWKMKNMMGGGKIEKERFLEEELIIKAKNASGSFSVMRIGELEDDSGPSLTKEKLGKAPKSRVAISPGDKLEGAVPMSTVAGLLARSLKEDSFINSTYSIGEAPEPDRGGAGASDQAYWDDQFVKLLGPDIYRSNPVKADAEWVRAWAAEFLKQGKLVTPTDLVPVDNGVMLRFKKRVSTYMSRTPAEAAAKLKANKEAASGKSDGALLIVAEQKPGPRIRVARAEMAEGIIVKAMSEEEVLRQLDIDVSRLEKEQNR
mmetsp:Transcript_10804/g.20189  ORF Transcript_10804/g.20189 Transcript_10804/m.20189 type:complete len:597 (+) Transcript_10804:85-1875(+)